MRRRDSSPSRELTRRDATKPAKEDGLTESSSDDDTSGERPGDYENDCDPADNQRYDMAADMEEEPTSSSGSSSESDSSDDDSDPDPAEVEEIMRGEVAQYTESSGYAGIQPLDATRSSDLSSRIASFLPALKASNAKLQQAISYGQGQAHTLEVEDDEAEPHVDVNLSLGVLEKMDDGNAESQNDDDEDTDDSSSGLEPSAGPVSDRKRKPGVLDTLMGRPKRPKPGIEEVEEVGEART